MNVSVVHIEVEDSGDFGNKERSHTMNRLRYYIVDAFTNRPFAGNPAAVVPLDQWKDDAWLQNVAMEMNLSETAYLVPNAQGYDLRWFTPKVEVDLCSHATLASAIVLARFNKLADGTDMAFSTRSGILRAERHGSRFQLDFPIKAEKVTAPPPGLLESLNVASRYVGRNKFDYLVEVESEAVVRRLAPDFKGLARRRLRNGGDERPTGHGQVPVPAAGRRGAVLHSAEAELPLAGGTSERQAPHRGGNERQQRR